MASDRDIHPDFNFFLDMKEARLISLYKDLREYIFSLAPDTNELLYHTHALTSAYSISERLGDTFIMLPIYSKHFNLAFNKGTLLDDPHQLLTGTGKLMRHIPINAKSDYRNPKVKALIKASIALAIEDMNKPTKSVGKTISKIKR